MTAIALLTEVPRFCPACGSAINPYRNQYTREDWLAHCTHQCRCGLRYVLVNQDDAITAATASGSDLARHLDD